MGVDLTRGHNDEISFNWQAWRYLLETADAYGWRPEGTLPPPYYIYDREWNGSYFSNDWQEVRATDAAAMAAALERACTALRAAIKEQVEIDDDLIPFEYNNLSRDLRLLEDFARFAARGHFFIG